MSLLDAFGDQASGPATRAELARDAARRLDDRRAEPAGGAARQDPLGVADDADGADGVAGVVGIGAATLDSPSTASSRSRARPPRARP